jgi:hypothetical protein
MKVAAIATTLLVGSAAYAQDTGVFTYEMFETAVQHVNLMDCPGDLAGEGRFCRMTMHNDAFHVFAFSEEGEQPMVGLKTWYEDEIDMTFK